MCLCWSWPYVIYFPTAMARYSLFVLKVPLNTKQTNKNSLPGASDHSLHVCENPACITSIYCIYCDRTMSGMADSVRTKALKVVI